MVHVLHEVHTALRPGGRLLDLHPLPRHPRVEVLLRDRSRLVGLLDDTAGNELTRAARVRLNAVVREGLFRVEARRYFDGLIHYTSVDAWLRRRKEYGSTTVIPPGFVRRARGMMRAPGTTLVIGERVRATVLRRLPSPARRRSSSARPWAG